jgi:F-type H+-transporting ATPase subunit epsilon
MPEALFPLRVLSPLGTVFQGEVKAVSLPTMNGDITVLAHHMPLVTALIEGEVRITGTQGDVSIAISGGFLEFSGDGARILSDFAAEAASIEIARMEAAKKRAEDLLKEKKERKDLVLVERDLQRAILQLKVAEKVRKRRSGPG